MWRQASSRNTYDVRAEAKSKDLSAPSLGAISPGPEHTACEEIRYDNGSMISIDYIEIENTILRNMNERAELD